MFLLGCAEPAAACGWAAAARCRAAAAHITAMAACNGALRLLADIDGFFCKEILNL